MDSVATSGNNWGEIIYIFLYKQKNKTLRVHPLDKKSIHPFPIFNMPRNEVDTDLITNEPRKRKLTSYVTNKDNISADKDNMVKRMKRTMDPSK